MVDEGTEREQARQWLADRPAESDAHDGDEAMTDLGLINRVAHHHAEHPDQDEKALADALAALIATAPQDWHMLQRVWTADLRGGR